MESRYIEAGGFRLHMNVGTPSGPPMVLVHGLGVSSRYLLPTARALERKLTVYAPDLPGSGKSETPAEPLDLRALAEILLRWLDVMKLERASFLGNSMGCQVLVELALLAPDRVDRLVLTGPTVDPQWRSFAKQIPRWLLEIVREPLKLLPTLIRDYLRFGPLRFFRTGRFAIADRMEEKLSRIRAPTLVVRGARDAFVSTKWIERIARLLPNGRAVVVPNAAHAVTYSAPEALARIILDCATDFRPVGLASTMFLPA
jgi:pimeloyl-ACP methyl ester carboxylesterase